MGTEKKGGNACRFVMFFFLLFFTTSFFVCRYESIAETSSWGPPCIGNMMGTSWETHWDKWEDHWENV